MKLPLLLVLPVAMLLSLPLAAQTPSALPSGKIELFLLAGQSNMTGRGDVKELSAEYAAADPRVWALNRDGAWQPAMDPLHWDKTAAGVGPGDFSDASSRSMSPKLSSG